MEQTPGENRKSRIRSLGGLFLAFLKMGLFTIGGGMAMIPQMQQLAVEEHHWLTEGEVVDCIAVSQSLPGVIAINLATFIGRRVCGLAGAIAATVGVVLPSFVIIILAVLVLDQIEDNPWLNGAFVGVKAAVCGLILVTAVRLGKQVLRSVFGWILMICSLIAVGVLGISAVWVILGAAILGIAYTLIRSRKGERAGASADPETDAPEGEQRKGAPR